MNRLSVYFSVTGMLLIGVATLYSAASDSKTPRPQILPVLKSVKAEVPLTFHVRAIVGHDAYKTRCPNETVSNPQALSASERLKLRTCLLNRDEAIESLNREMIGAGGTLTTQFSWDFGNPRGRYNCVSGFNFARVYDEPGVYTVTLRVRNHVNRLGIKRYQFRVLPSTRKVFYVSPSGADSNPGTIAKPLKTWNEVVRRVEERKHNVEVRFQRGRTFSAETTMNL